ncbi:hypothetical protein Aph02nite_34030 [Actinoplanes philippinensis]|uniref:Uncharacterized protein n=1 Tax=Actinoplanes philippinensis TaxID=35752 RepID=A0A1I2F647_9ACTN|nr:hypothetical protein [Actinoplanes philippinensis]GIE77453.1 hypothetical protein Aph02nite_34030 [Actinoplanes philippinensis]SFF00021.1 hypothetical protein SAMN05421541_10596 [Actinoplanes philippinensis]
MKAIPGFIAVGVAITAVIGIGAAVASAAEPTGGDVLGSLVENYSYPGVPADLAPVLADRKVELTSGDGHIVLNSVVRVDENCPARVAGAGRIVVVAGPQLDGQALTRSVVEPADTIQLCFDVLAASGQLSLKVPAVYELDGRTAAPAGQTVKSVAKIQPEGGQETVVPLSSKNTIQVGKGINEANADATLLELVVTGA